MPSTARVSAVDRTFTIQADAPIVENLPITIHMITDGGDCSATLSAAAGVIMRDGSGVILDEVTTAGVPVAAVAIAGSVEIEIDSLGVGDLVQIDLA